LLQGISCHQLHAGSGGRSRGGQTAATSRATAVG
jgi:hypothetical protein